MSQKKKANNEERVGIIAFTFTNATPTYMNAIRRSEVVLLETKYSVKVLHRFGDAANGSPRVLAAHNTGTLNLPLTIAN